MYDHIGVKPEPLCLSLFEQPTRFLRKSWIDGNGKNQIGCDEEVTSKVTGQRYRMGDFIVMPNHVHLLAAFQHPKSMRETFDSWLHFTAVKINRKLSQKGHFWQEEPFDHLVRSEEQYRYLVNYVATNPKKARLPEGSFFYRKYAT